MKTETIQLESRDGHRLSAYCARPADTPRTALVVVQELFGVNAHIRDLCNRFAADGHLAIAPALYDRVERNAELAYGPEGVARGREIRQHITDEQALVDVEAALAWAKASMGPEARAGVIGYCWGGTLAWLAATRLEGLSAAVGYYGTGIAGYRTEAPRVPVLLHFGLQDAHISATDVQGIMASRPEVEVHQYDAGHGFNCDDRASFSQSSATLAHERTSGFLARHLRAGDGA